LAGAVVTPGFAKPRSELPWLPFGEQDRVIINAHNFTPAGPTLLGGEIGIWCPSFDTVGNGTTTLTDLVGSADGTLTNFSLSGSTSNWVSDTDSGGVRALDFDGVNDFVVTPNITLPATFTVSLWAKIDYASSTNFARIVEHGLNDSFTLCINKGFFANKTTVQYADFAGGWIASSTDITANWVHLCVTMSKPASLMTGVLYENGVSVGTNTKTATPSNNVPLRFGGEATSANFTSLRGRLDDIRVFNRVLSGSEITALASKRGY
jgi:hypothetical protein